mmetsp:Transcript_12873/g.36428  ORF Transcript_12873/g.36428 Transcript_12873/m.36428 type:complete len:404 (+) Transcript_12873:2152-3363(+)
MAATWRAVLPVLGSTKISIPSGVNVWHSERRPVMLSAMIKRTTSPHDDPTGAGGDDCDTSGDHLSSPSCSSASPSKRREIRNVIAVWRWSRMSPSPSSPFKERERSEYSSKCSLRTKTNRPDMVWTMTRSSSEFSSSPARVLSVLSHRFRTASNSRAISFSISLLPVGKYSSIMGDPLPEGTPIDLDRCAMRGRFDFRVVKGEKRNDFRASSSWRSTSMLRRDLRLRDISLTRPTEFRFVAGENSPGGGDTPWTTMGCDPELLEWKSTLLCVSSRFCTDLVRPGCGTSPCSSRASRFASDFDLWVGAAGKLSRAIDEEGVDVIVTYDSFTPWVRRYDAICSCLNRSAIASKLSPFLQTVVVASALHCTNPACSSVMYSKYGRSPTTMQRTDADTESAESGHTF